MQYRAMVEFANEKQFEDFTDWLDWNGFNLYEVYCEENNLPVAKVDSMTTDGDENSKTLTWKLK